MRPPALTGEDYAGSHLPVRLPPTRVAAAGSCCVPMQEPGRRCRVVICDDSAEYRTVLALMLRLDGNVEVVGEAGDGAEAIEVAERLQPDAMLLDVSMPNVDGIQAAPRIRAVAPQCRVVMLTGLASPAVRDRAFDAGASAYLDKGEPFAAILAVILEHCGAARGASAGDRVG